MSLEQVNKLLLGLNASELQEVRARCGALLQGAAAPAPTASARNSRKPLNEDARLILEELSAFLREQGIEYAGVEKLQGMANYRAFEEKVPALMKYYNRVTRNRTKQRALMRMSVKLLYADLNRMNVSASVRTMMNHFHRVPSVINRHFPGYAAAGLLGLLLKDGFAVDRYVYQDTQQAGAEADEAS